MKKLYYFFFILIVIFSCTKERFVGIWNLATLEENDKNQIKPGEKASLEFESDGFYVWTIISKDREKKVRGNWNLVKDSKITMKKLDIDEPFIGTYSFDGDRLTIKGSEDGRYLYIVLSKKSD